jgi:hypothetical protein
MLIWPQQLRSFCFTLPEQEFGTFEEARRDAFSLSSVHDSAGHLPLDLKQVQQLLRIFTRRLLLSEPAARDDNAACFNAPRAVQRASGPRIGLRRHRCMLAISFRALKRA